uniref:PX domain-containing protein n=1 Tax=Panagrolaimus sp. PS1159 TaxID=55785 RepID=A0AC35F4B4_9BILA
MLFARGRSSSSIDSEAIRSHSVCYIDATKDGDKLSASFVANGNRRRSRSQSRATSGSRTDLSTDDEFTAISGHPSPSPGPENVTVAKEGTKTDEQTKEGPPSTRNNGSKVVLNGDHRVL